MRGFRALGRVDLVSSRDYHESDLLFFAPHEDGSGMRCDAAGTLHGFRARDFDLFQCQTFVSMGACPSDYVFVATAVGEGAFDAIRQDLGAE